uniref:Secreted protein n=1 Tax=Steinernema glaseri TaxID=37863 RepID=A0A1I7ZK02_9BILA
MRVNAGAGLPPLVWGPSTISRSRPFYVLQLLLIASEGLYGATKGSRISEPDILCWFEVPPRYRAPGLVMC